ncbi:MAG TPA: TMEM165/GDT1 family protein [Frankiaceae bacterium]|nr:TMEM165/GDT1 family protein [Frankiaceae bacterium]
MSIRAFLTTYGVVLPAELPDKTALASLVLASTYRKPLAVWAGGAAAFFAQCAIAVAAGSLLALLPDRAVAGVAAVLFAAGAVLALRGRAEEPSYVPAAGRRVAAVTFGVLFLAEWGDFTQLATASLASRYEAPFSVFLGAWLALCTVCGLAVLLGRGLLRVVPLRVVRLVAAGIFAVVAVVSAAQAVT